VWILSSDFWTGMLSLADDLTSLLSDTELNQALALEAEIDSGVSAFASQVGALRLDQQTPSGSRWCVTHIGKAELQHVIEALKHSGAQVVGAAHPAAARICQAAAADSQRVDELLLGWDEELAKADSLNSTDIRASVTTWAEGWAECLAQTPLVPLVVRLAPRPLSAAQRTMTSAALALVAAGACGLWHWHTQQRIVAAERTLAELEQRQSAQDAMQRNLQTLETHVAKLRKEASQAEAQRRALESDLYRADRTHAQHNRRWLALLDAIAGSIDEQCWIQRLESQPVQTTVHGLALDNAAAHRFASALEVGLQGSGWTVLPAETKLTEQRLVAFRIVLTATAGPIQNDETDAVQLSANEPTGGYRRPADRAQASAKYSGLSSESRRERL
jgi:Tfp pilus assembly protein PilN